MKLLNTGLDGFACLVKCLVASIALGIEPERPVEVLRDESKWMVFKKRKETKTTVRLGSRHNIHYMH